MTQDLTKITSPFGLLDAKTQDALVAAQEAGLEIQLFKSIGGWAEMAKRGVFSRAITYRVKPEPVTVSVWTNVYPDGCGCSYDCRKAADSSASSKRLTVLRIDFTDGEVSFHKEDI